MKNQIENPDLTKLKEAVKSYIDLFEEGYEVDTEHNLNQLIAVAAIEAFYGKEIWQFINERLI